MRLLERLGGRGPLSAVEPPSMLSVDGADHSRYRRLVTRSFSARAVAALRRAGAADHGRAAGLDGMAAAGTDGSVDLVQS
jgi:cytochrome P450